MKAFLGLTAAVLAAIGIGAGLVGGLAYPQVPSCTYGRPPYVFSAAVPLALGGEVSSQCLDTSVGCTATPELVERYAPGWDGQ